MVIIMIIISISPLLPSPQRNKALYATGQSAQRKKNPDEKRLRFGKLFIMFP